MEDKKLNGSYLFYWLNKLSVISKESTNSGVEFNEFNKYMHIKREIESELVDTVKKINSTQKSHLIFLAGSSGDGKSHLISYLNENHKMDVEDFRFYRDATESDDLDLEAEQVLEKKLVDFSDEGLLSGQKTKMVLAINLGVLSNFLSNESVRNKYEKVTKFIETSEVLSEGNAPRKVESPDFTIINFSGYNDLEFQDGHLISYQLEKLFSRIFNQCDSNPFYKAYKKDLAQNIENDYISNYQMLLNKDIQKMLINLIIMIKIEENIILPTRTLLDFIFRIIVPPTAIDNKRTTETIIDNTFVNLLFTQGGKGKLIRPFQTLDIMNLRSEKVDTIISEMFIKDMVEIIDEHFPDTVQGIFLGYLKAQQNLLQCENTKIRNKLVQTIIRMIWLSGVVEFKECYQVFDKFVYYLNGYNSGNSNVIEEIIEFIIKAIYGLLGDDESTYVNVAKTKSVYLKYKLEIGDGLETIYVRNAETSISTVIKLPFKELETNTIVDISMDFKLFKLLYKVNDGYKPNKQDEEDAIKFLVQLKKLAKAGQYKTELSVSLENISADFLFKKGKKMGKDSYEFLRRM
ncbi:MAG: DNA phosphorothioation-dependent restriction protein DptF [Lachnospiraceae bacterium]